MIYAKVLTALLFITLANAAFADAPKAKLAVDCDNDDLSVTVYTSNTVTRHILNSRLSRAECPMHKQKIPSGWIQDFDILTVCESTNLSERTTKRVLRITAEDGSLQVLSSDNVYRTFEQCVADI